MASKIFRALLALVLVGLSCAGWGQNGVSLGLADSRYLGPGVNDFVVSVPVLTPSGVQAAINQAYAAGGGYVVLAAGTVNLGTTSLIGYPNVHLIGVHPFQTFTDNVNPDAQYTFTGGTVLMTDGSIPSIVINNVDQGSVPSNLAATATNGFSCENIGFDSGGVSIGCANNIGLAFGWFRHCFFRSCASWAMTLTNAWDVRIEDCYFVGCFNGIYDRTALPASSTEPGHVRKDHCMYQAPLFNAAVTANGTATLSVSTANALYLSNSMPVTPTTSVDGLTALTTYYVVGLNRSTGAFGLATTVGGTALTMSGSTSFNIRPPNWMCRGLLWSCDTVASSQPTNDETIECQSNMQNRWHTLSQVATPVSTSSTLIGVTDATQFLPGMPWHTTTTQDGVTANLLYVVQTVNTSTNQVTVGTSLSATPITPSATTPFTITSYGFAPFEIQCADSASHNVASTWLDCDSEGTAETGFYIDGANQYAVTMQNSPTTDMSGVAIRRGGFCRGLEQSQGQALDIDAASSNVRIGGQITSPLQRWGFGEFFDSASGCYEFNLASSGSAISNWPNLRLQQPASDGNIILAATPIASMVSTRTGGGNLSATSGEVVVCTNSSTITLNLPTIVTDQGALNTVINANVGQHWIIENQGTAVITVDGATSQPFGNSTGPTSITVPIGQSMYVLCERDGAGNLFYGAHLWNASTSAAPYNIANFFSSIGNSGSTSTTLYTASVPGGTLNANGQKLHALWAGAYTSNSNVKSLAVTFAGSNFMPISSSTLNVGAWQVEVWLQESSATTVAYTVKYTTQQSTGAVSATYAGYLTGLTLSSANTLLISGTGAATNDLYGYSGFIEWEP